MNNRTDSELGRIDGYCGLELRYPNNPNYMAGYKRGVAVAQSEYFERDSLGPNEANSDCFNL